MPDALGCTANSFSCGTDDALYQCDAEGAALTKVQDCQYGCTGDHCNECEANTTFCSGDDLVSCDSSGTIVNPQTCGFGCQMDRCNTCDPGVAYCDGATAVTCGANGEPAAMMSCGGPGCSNGVCNSCTPNTTTCQGDTLVVCNGSGTVQSATTCSLGCGTTPAAHCKAMVPSYGVPAPSGSLPDLVVDAESTLNIANCNALDVALTKGAVTTALPTAQVALVSQTNGPPICVVRFGSITIAAGFTLRVVNAASPEHVLSLQAVRDIVVNGTLAFASSGTGPSPGATVLTVGLNNTKNKAAGAGGAGAARAGGVGGKCVGCVNGATSNGGSGGAAVTTIATRLVGGSSGGNVLDMADTTVTKGFGGGAGGGLQVVSLTRFVLAATGRISLNGGGGSGIGFSKFSDYPAGGGGSGGTLVVEAPVVNLSTGAIVAANGGGGAGGCFVCNGMFPPSCTHFNGQPGQLSATRAAGGDCPQQGDGGFEANGVATPTINGADSDTGGTIAAGGGGGGSSGFIILRGRTSAAVMIAGGAIVSPMATVSAVTAN